MKRVELIRVDNKLYILSGGSYSEESYFNLEDDNLLPSKAQFVIKYLLKEKEDETN